MRVLRAFSMGMILITLTLGTGTASTSREQHARRVVGYFAEWSQSDAAELPGALLTHVIYAFGRIKDGQIIINNAAAAIERPYPADSPGDALPFRGHFRQLQVLKQKHPHIRTLISIGGWGGSAPFSDLALSEASRETFARSCAEFISKYGFDGIDIDWEYPGGGGKEPDAGRPEDKQNFTVLLQELRQRLDEQGKIDQKRYLLTIAAPASADHYKHIELHRIHESLDWINLMTYDFTGGWSKLSGLNAPLYAPSEAPGRSCLDHSVRGYLDAGVPAEKLVVGVPFYGRAFGGVKDVNHGLYQPHDRKPPKPPDGGEWTYRNLAANHFDKGPTRFWQEQARVPWLYDPKSELMVSYDDPESLRLKAEYVKSHHLGGVMIWELSQDDDRHSLLKALNAGLASARNVAPQDK